jgi:hypothetical protein
MNRSEHLQWCKNRALEYVDAGDNQQAMSSMISDLRKHEGTANSVHIALPLGMIAVMSGSADEMRSFINGFG